MKETYLKEQLMFPLAMKEDRENNQLKHSKMQQMCQELEVYLVRKKPGNMLTLKRLLEKGHHEPLTILQQTFFLENSTYLRKFNEIAKKYQYFFKRDVQNAVSELTCIKEEEQEQRIKTIKKWKQFNAIKEISYRQETDSYQMETDFGGLVFTSARKTYPIETKRMEDILRKEDPIEFSKLGLDYRCHFTAEEFVKMHKECFFVTCQCPRSTWWHHSYVLSEDEKTVIDFANDIIMPRVMFDTLFEPNQLIQIKGSDLEKAKAYKREGTHYEGLPLLTIEARERQLSGYHKIKK